MIKLSLNNALSQYILPIVGVNAALVTTLVLVLI